ncbi:MAG: sensor N-terminal transmembrane domain-containing protein, partial [Pseudomonadota bacterium]
MALAEGGFLRDTSPPASRDGDVVLGDDWVAPDTVGSGDEIRASRAKRGWFSLRSSPLTRKIITFNLIALNILVAGILYLNSSRDSLAEQRAASLVTEAELVADVIEAQLPAGAPVNLITGDGVDVRATLEGLDLRAGVEVFVYDPSDTLIARQAALTGTEPTGNRTVLTDGLSWIWAQLSAPFADASAPPPPPLEDQLAALVPDALSDGTLLRNTLTTEQGTKFGVLTPIEQNGRAVGILALTSAAGEIDHLVRTERERVLQMFVIA